MRQCSNPDCKAPIEGCFGTIKAGDALEAIEGTRKWSDVRELCPKCATRMVFLCTSDAERLAYFPKVGWA